MSIYINGSEHDSQAHTYEYPAAGGPGMFHVQNDPSKYEPARINTFEFIPNFTSDMNLRDVITGEKLDALVAQETFRLAVKNIKFSHPKIATNTQRRGNSAVNFAGDVSYSEGSMTMYDWIGADPKSVVLAWLNAAYNCKTDKMGIMTDYKCNGILTEYTPDYQPVRRWQVIGVFVTGVDEGAFDKTDSKAREITCSLAFDRQIPIPLS